MKVGDLVTLSEYGKNLTSIERRFKYNWADGYIYPMGLVVKIEETRFADACVDISQNERYQYHIQWVNAGPKGRTYYGGYFLRKDLKFARK